MNDAQVTSSQVVTLRAVLWLLPTPGKSKHFPTDFLE